MCEVAVAVALAVDSGFYGLLVSSFFFV